MASPFKAFRKHQKVLIAVLALLAMFAFVVLPIILQGMGSQPTKDRVVVTTASYGDIRESRLWTMVRNRHVLGAFFSRVAQAIVVAGGDSRVARIVENAIGPSSEEAVVETWLLAERAKELGLVVSEQTIRQFLRSLTVEQGITDDQVNQIMDTLGLSTRRLFGLLRQELLARQLERLFQVSLAGMPPAQRWDYYQRLKRKAAIEAVPVPVPRFVDEVANPSEATLREFFEQRKEDPYVPTSPEPGFLEPHKIAVEYFKAEYEKLADIAEVTQEDISKYYEQFKDRDYRKQQLPQADEKEPGAAAEPGQETDRQQTAEPDDTAETEEGVAPDKGAAQEPTSNEEGQRDTEPAKPERNGTDAKDQPGSAPAKGSTQDKEDQAETKSVEKAPGEAAGLRFGPAGDTSSLEAHSAFHLASLLQEDNSEDEDAQPQQWATHKDLEPESQAGSEVVGPKLQAANKDAGPEPPAAKEDARPEQSAAESVEYVPLEEVQDEIRNRLADEKVRGVLGRLRDKMQRYHDEWTVYQALPAQETQAKTPPQKPNIRDLAKENGLSAHKTELIAAFEAEQLDIGKSSLEGNISFVRYAYQKLPEYRPEISQDDEGNYYLFWKVAETEQRIPDFEDPGVRDQVLRAWKMVQARSLARKEAERLAAQVRDRGQSLREFFADQPDMNVLQSEPFSWMTYGAFPAWWARTPPRINEIKARIKDPQTGEETQQDAVQMPGDELMREVFSLTKGETGVAMNQPKTLVYILRVTDINPAPEVLWRLFLAEDYSNYRLVAAGDQAQTRQAWQNGIKSAVGFKWERAPDRDLRR